ncbi:MAG: class I SAM-dependent methyltransferase [Methanothrix sp.]|uniref:methyltransferase domain-containing protein n=1 Tax=Methanothrix sp. TaxID=90426 RepID=UPI0025F05892|nr:class I SAM-dependent methyltransferase [Methanothrix sp.]MCQ8903657.1 class I SAM-dependent methyltransferase [Methanothrix sp.]
MKLPGTATQPENIQIAMGKLDIRKGMTFLDIGCGSGAVSLAASRYTEKIYGIDRRHEAVEASRSLVPFGNFICGEAVDIIPGLPEVDRCFIGGTRDIERFLPALRERAAPGLRLVVDVARIGMAAKVAGLVEDLFTLEEVLQINISRGYRLAGDIALKPVNPIFMIVGRGD